MAEHKTVLGLGPLPKKPPRWRVVRRRATVSVVDAVKAAIVDQVARERDAAIGGWTGETVAQRIDRERYRPLEEGPGPNADTTKARATATMPVFQGANLRPAGVNVPMGRTLRSDGSVKTVRYPFGVTRFKKQVRGVTF